MRCLARDTKDIFVSLYETKVEVVNSDGLYTGEYEVKRSDPIKVTCNVGASVGTSQLEVFGQLLNYDKTIIIDNVDFEISETAVLWVDVDTSKPFDYIVKRVAKTPNYIALAVSKVDVSND